MFTSRAEARLHLRIDNADERLTPVGRQAGLVCDRRWSLFERKQRHKAALVAALEVTRVTPNNFPDLSVAAEDRPTVSTWLKRPEASAALLNGWFRSVLGGDEPAPGVVDTVVVEAKYAGYIEQQERQLMRVRASEDRRIPESFRYRGVPGLSREIQDKLERYRPETLAQAGRISGVTPAAVSVLEVLLRVGRGA
jgi:tRNA uridine 5-carboxymethylaminomethyl modification enzyme